MKDLLSAARDLARRGAVDSSALWLGQMGFSVNNGDFDYAALGLTPDADGYVFTRNRVVNEGLNHLLNAGVLGTGTISTWYLAPFAANVTPAATLTAATYAATVTEFTNYDEVARPVWTADGSATALVLENAVDPALFTIGAGLQTTIYGGGLVSASAKSATTGTLLAAAKLPTGLTGLAEGFEVRLKYRLTASSS